MKLNFEPKATYKKVLIDKGYYIGKCVEIKPFEDEEGKPVIGSFKDVETKKVIFTFEVLDKQNKPILFEGEVATLSSFYNSEYKKKGEDWRSALTPNGSLTKTLQALGAVFTDPAQIDTDDYIGKTAELLIDDYDKKLDDGSIQTFSVIKEVKPLKSNPKTKQPEVETIVYDEELDARIDGLKKQLKDGLLSQKGYDMAVATLKR
jgi:hypothetical protein